MTDHRQALAHDAGYTGEDAEAFASLLVGDTDDELKAHADRLVAFRESMKPPSPPAVDPSQGHGSAPRPSAEQWFAGVVTDMAARSGPNPNRFPEPSYGFDGA